MKYFIDLGSHLFESVNLFKELIPNASSYHIVSFEAAYDGDLKDSIDQKLQTSDFENYFASFTFLPLVVAPATGVSNFYRDRRYPLSESSTTVPGKLSRLYDTQLKATISLSGFLNAFIRPDDYVILKSDIEGAEYDLIKHLHVTRSLSLVDLIFIELHAHKISKTLEDDLDLINIISEYHVPIFSWDAVPLNGKVMRPSRITPATLQRLYKY